MPNTDPPQDSLGVVEFVRAQGEAAGLCDVLPAGCITVGRAGEQLAPFGELAAAGVRLFTDDGNGVQDPLLMRRALEYAPGSASRSPSTARSPPDPGRGDARGFVLQPSRPARAGRRWPRS